MGVGAGAGAGARDSLASNLPERLNWLSAWGGGPPALCSTTKHDGQSPEHIFHHFTVPEDFGGVWQCHSRRFTGVTSCPPTKSAPAPLPDGKGLVYEELLVDEI